LPKIMIMMINESDADCRLTRHCEERRLQRSNLALTEPEIASHKALAMTCNR
jgi:hypothetical protein